MTPETQTTMMTTTGITIPLILKRKWKNEKKQDRKNNNSAPANKGKGLKFSQDFDLTAGETNELKNRVFTASELESRIWETKKRMMEISQQLYRDEEVYYENTYNHGSIYKGWDAFVDAKDIDTSGPSSTQGTGRRVPADMRWFSGSCKSFPQTVPTFSSFHPHTVVPSENIVSSNYSSRGTPTVEAIAPIAITTPGNSCTSTSIVTTAHIDIALENKVNSVNNRTSIALSAIAGEEGVIAAVTNLSKTETSPMKLLHHKDKDITMKPTNKKRKLASATNSEEQVRENATQEIPSTAIAYSAEFDKQQQQQQREKEQLQHQYSGIDKTVKMSSSITKSSNVKASTNTTNVDTSSSSSRSEKEEKVAATPIPRKRGRPRRKN